jgi:TolB protein
MIRRVAALGSVLTTMALVTAATLTPVLAAGDRHAGGRDPGAGVRAGTNGQIAFRRYFDADQSKGAVFVMDPDGSDVRQVTFPPAGWRDNVPTWSPDGTRIAFERFKRDESTSRILVVDPDTGDTSTVVPCTSDRCAYAIDPFFSPDGRSLAYARTVTPPTAHPPEWQAYTAVFVVGLDGTGSRQVTSTPARHAGVFAVESTDPTFSPDGRLLAFIRTRHSPDENSAVFVQRLGAPGDARQVTPWTMGCQDRPTFSPDGDLLLFRCTPQGEDGPSNLYLAHPDSSGLLRLTTPSREHQYLGSGFSPGFGHGRGWITAGRTGGSGADGNADVFRLLVRDGQVVRRLNLTRSDEWDSAASWGTHPPVG